jgi:hypothetical protein
MVIGGMHVLDGTLSLGQLLVFMAYLAPLYAPGETLAYAFTTFSAAAASARRVLEVLDEEDRCAIDGALALPRVAGGVRVGLVPRFFDPSVGRVLIDGHDVRDVTIERLRAQALDRPAGAVPAAAQHRREHSVRPAGRDAWRDRRRGPCGQRARLHRTAAGGI